MVQRSIFPIFQFFVFPFFSGKLENRKFSSLHIFCRKWKIVKKFNFPICLLVMFTGVPPRGVPACVEIRVDFPERSA